MKEEIKEILDINIGDDREAYIDYIDKDGKRKNYEYIEAEDLLDYITNLQEENEKLKKGYYTVKVGLEEIGILNELRDYKTRNEKAIEYIKSNLDNTDWLEIGSQDVEVLLNILQGEQNE